MSSTSFPCPSARPAPSTLRDVAELVDQAGGEGAAAPAALIRVTPTAGALDLAMRPVDPSTEHPADELIGFDAPPDCSAIGLTTTARLQRFEPVGTVDATSAVVPVRLTVLVDRSGEVASVIRPLDGGASLTVPDSAPVGWVVDVCRRSLGLATPPPEVDVGPWIDASWVEAIVARLVAEPRRRRRWTDLARLHPLCPIGATPSPQRLRAETQRAMTEISWARLRELLVEDGRTGTAGGGSMVLSPAQAAWFDEGSLSRYLLARHPPLDALLDTTLALLPISLHGRVLDALSRPADRATPSLASDAPLRDHDR